MDFFQKRLLFLLGCLVMIPSSLFGQKIILEKYEQRSTRGYSYPDFPSFYYYLEEGVQSELIAWADGYTLPTNTLIDWACQYRSLFDEGFMKKDDGFVFYDTPPILHFSQNRYADSLIHEQVYLELLPNGSMDIHLVIRMVEVHSEIVQVRFFRPRTIPYLTTKQIKKKYKEMIASNRQSLRTNSPSFSASREETEIIRHQEACAKIRCQ